MEISESVRSQLKQFSISADFSRKGCLVLDLDGTALEERKGHVTIPQSIEQGVKAIHNLGRPVILNTLRFPLSVIKTIGHDWHKINNISVPVVLLNGSVLGHVVKTGNGELSYEEIISFPLQEKEVDDAIKHIKELESSVKKNFAVFYYPKNWALGEIIWTPNEQRKAHLREKYRSASEVICCDIRALAEKLKKEEVCMIFILLNEKKDNLMAYQHAQKNLYITRKGIDKLSGIKNIEKILKVSLPDSIGAGDTVMDNFLTEVGLAVCVGKHKIPFKGLKDTVKIETPSQLGNLLKEFAVILTGISK